LPGQRYNTLGVLPVIEGIPFDALIRDKAFDADWVTAAMRADKTDQSFAANIYLAAAVIHSR
jgi:hypothetical protein